MVNSRPCESHNGVAWMQHCARPWNFLYHVFLFKKMIAVGIYAIGEKTHLTCMNLVGPNTNSEPYWSKHHNSEPYEFKSNTCRVLVETGLNVYDFFHIWNLDDSKRFQDISMKQSSISYIFRTFHKTKYIGVWHIRWILTENHNIFQKS